MSCNAHTRVLNMLEKSRVWQVTHFPERSEEFLAWLSSQLLPSVEYMSVCEEYTKSGKKHWHYYFKLKAGEGKTGWEILCYFPRAHLERPVRGPAENLEYIKKCGTFELFGTWPEKRKYVKKPAGAA